MTERNASEPTAEDLIACFRSGQIEADEMVQICRERPDVLTGLRAVGVV